MHRYFIAGALACFGPSLFSQTIPIPSSQPQGTLNNVQNSIPSGLQGTTGTAVPGIQQSSGTTDPVNGQNRSSLDARGQLNVAPSRSGGLGVQNSTNLQNNSNGQPAQVNSNLSTQLQGQPPVRQQGGSNVLQNNYNQQRNAFQTNGSNGSQAIQRTDLRLQPGQSQGQIWNADANQNVRSAQYRQPFETGNSWQSNYLPQSGQSQNSGPVYLLRFDANCEEYICVNGRAVYFDRVNSQPAQGNSGTSYRAGYGNYDLNNSQNSQDQSRLPEQFRADQQNSRDPNSLGTQPNSNSNQTNSLNATNSNDKALPTPDRLDVDSQNQLTEPQINNETKSNLEADSARPGNVQNGLPKPKL